MRPHRPAACAGFRRNCGFIFCLAASLLGFAGSGRSADLWDILPANRHSSASDVPPRVVNHRSTPSRAAISFRPSPWDKPPARPLRQIDLINGDRFTAEILSGTATAIDVRWLGCLRFRIPRAVIDRVAHLPGEREVLNDDFADGVQTVSADSGPFRLNVPALPGDFCCSLRFRVLPTGADGGDVTEWTARFGDARRLGVQRNADGIWRTSGLTSRHAIRESDGWHVLRWRQTAGRMFLSLDGSLLSAEPPPAATPGAGEIRVDSHDRRPAAAVFIDHVSVVVRDQTPLEFPSRQAADAVIGSAGDVWWGRIEDLDAKAVAWQDAGTRWRLTWPELQGVLLGERPQAVAGRRLTGNIISLRLQPLSVRPDLPGDRLTAALGSSQNNMISVDHPLLGRLVIPMAAVQSVGHRHTGVSHLLDAREIVLKKSAVNGSSTPLGGQFLVETVPPDGIDFTVEVAGLEPAGPNTPPGSPTLKTLRSGRLVTELFVNGTRIGNFNELTSDWSLPGTFDRLRLRIPADRLRAGWNTWMIAQQPGAGPRTTYDECRMRNFAWESDGESR